MHVFVYVWMSVVIYLCIYLSSYVCVMWLCVRLLMYLPSHVRMCMCVMIVRIYMFL